jgi:cellulose biosynthesis protein BcsQ
MSHKGYNFIVVDCDDEQTSIATRREKEIQAEVIPKEHEKNMYEILRVKSQDFVDFFNDNLDGHYDYVLVDIPGNIAQKGVKQTIVFYDYMFVPLGLSSFDTDSLEKFIAFYRDKVMPILKEYDKKVHIYGVVYRVNKQTRAYKQFYYQDRDHMPFPFLENVVPQAQVFADEANTYMPYHELDNNKTRTVEFAEEIISIISNNVDHG